MASLTLTWSPSQQIPFRSRYLRTMEHQLKGGVLNIAIHRHEVTDSGIIRAITYISGYPAMISSRPIQSPVQISIQIFIQRKVPGVLAALLLFLSANIHAEPVDFALPDVKGVEHKLSDFRGKWVVVNYWATWCPPCLSEIPELVDFHEEHKDKDAVVLGVNFEDIGIKGLKQFSEEYFINYPVLRAKPGPRSALGSIPGLPTTYLISPDGEIAARQVGPVTGKLINDFIEQQTTE